MKPLEPLTTEEKQAICKECGGFCCKYFFLHLGDNDAGIEFHKFRNRKIVRYGVTNSLLVQDQCPHQQEDGLCSKYPIEGSIDERPLVCQQFPVMYSPFWNLRCKLQRELYKRGLLKRDVKKFNQLKAEIYKKKKPKNYFQILKF